MFPSAGEVMVITGAVVSRVIVIDDVPVFPAASAAMAVIVFAPSVRFMFEAV